MTTCAMIFGMLPLALALVDGAELQAGMGRAIMGGVMTSTLLTLVVVPVLYAIFETSLEKRRARKAEKAAAKALQVGAVAGASTPAAAALDKD